MANCMILYPNRADLPAGAYPGASLDGGNWHMPLTNLQDRRTSRVARSASTDPEDTQFTVTMGGQREIRVLALVRHNLTVTASWRARAWYSDGSVDDPAFDSGMLGVYPSLAYTEDLAWENEAWWDGRQGSEELEGYAQNAIMVLPEFVTAPNWLIEVFDVDNPANYVQAARLFMAGGWQPSQNYAYGSAHGIETDTTVEKTYSGAEVFDRREPFRVAKIGFEYLPEDEALLKGLDLCRRAGIDGEVFWIADPGNPRTLTQTSFLGRLRQLSLWEQAVFQRANIGFEIKETL